MTTRAKTAKGKHTVWDVVDVLTAANLCGRLDKAFWEKLWAGLERVYFLEPGAASTLFRPEVRDLAEELADGLSANGLCKPEPF